MQVCPPYSARSAFWSTTNPKTSDEKRIAPLVFYPIELDRELQNGEYRYFISGKNEDVEINVVLERITQARVCD